MRVPWVHWVPGMVLSAVNREHTATASYDVIAEGTAAQCAVHHADRFQSEQQVQTAVRAISG